MMSVQPVVRSMVTSNCAICLDEAFPTVKLKLLESVAPGPERVAEAFIVTEPATSPVTTTVATPPEVADPPGRPLTEPVHGAWANSSHSAISYDDVSVL